MVRQASLLALFLLVSASAALAGDEGNADPAQTLTNRTYCAVPVGDDRLAAGTTYGVLFYDLPEAEGTPAKPLRLEPAKERLLLPDSVNDLAMSGDLLVVANGPSGIRLVRGLQRQQSPSVVTQIDTPGAAVGVAARGTTLAVALGVMGVALYDLTDPLKPSAIAHLDTAGYARQVHILEDSSATRLRLAVANGRGGIATIDVAPDSGQILASNTIAKEGDVRQIVPVEGGMVASHGSHGVCLHPHVSRKAPRHCLDVADIARGLAVKDGRLLVGDGGAGLMTVTGIDDWEPTAPVRYRYEAGSINRLYLFGETVVLAADYYGLLVFPVDTL